MTGTVLYIHGLESGPQGRKARSLAQAGYRVVAEQMPCGQAQLARDPVVLGMVGGAALAVTGSTLRWGLPGLLLSAGAAGAAAPWAKSRVSRRMLHRSLQVQRLALQGQAIQSVVGSSFGGAVSLQLLLEGAWQGPTVLLCPAHRLIAERARLPMPPSLCTLPAEVSSRVVVVHGRADETVPLSHSEALVAGSRARLIVVDDDHRLSATASPENLASWLSLARGTKA